ncbi:MAG: alpha/beta hydrolase [Proteobacteria bacterium]|nr:alpha/beta hydrolase [Pseudomonadota bacterium]TDJ36564.1 MAG: alpha/beta hydrolase [Gammaproteobacteria bacterium]
MSDTHRVVCLPGIWMPGAGMMYIKHRLESDSGYHVDLFSYAPVTETLNDVAGKLADTFASAGNGPTHLVGYSLGGVVVLRMLALRPDLDVGRVVCLGSPLCGSRAAFHLSQLDWGNLILGKTIIEGVLDDAAHRWAKGVAESHEIGIIAGDVPIGFGRLVAGFDEANDGTVAISETRLPGAKDHLVLSVSHKGMLISRDVVDQTAAFLQRGEFLREA